MSDYYWFKMSVDEFPVLWGKKDPTSSLNCSTLREISVSLLFNFIMLKCKKNMTQKKQSPNKHTNK